MRRFLIPSIAALCLVAFVWAQSTRVGPLPSADSLAVNQRVGRTGETITQAAGGDNKERVRRGSCFYASDQSSGVAPGTVFGTTAHLVLYNPQNSGTLVIIRKVYDTYLSGTLGTGIMYHTMNNVTTQAAPTGGTLLTNFSALIGGTGVSQAQVRTGATVVAPFAVLAPMMYLSPELATTVTPPQQTFEDLNDGIQILPGCTYQLQAKAAAGTSPLMVPAVFWEEQPFLNGAP